MKGDFSRDTFNQRKHLLRVLMQQGRVQIDADWNEQVSILLHYVQSLASDMIGPYGKVDGAFEVRVLEVDSDLESLLGKFHNGIEISQLKKEHLKKSLETKGNFIISPGHYYVDGLLCENDEIIAYNDQRGYPFPGSLKVEEINQQGNHLLVYLDVWEQHICWCEEASNSIPGMREVALGLYGPDTATRSRLVWQAKIYLLEKGPFDCSTFEDIKNEFQPKNRGFLRAMAKKEDSSVDDRCSANPSAKYMGAENQLYRVEIHRSSGHEKSTFKWSRDNGSVIFPVVEGKIFFPSGKNGYEMSLTLAHLGLDDSKALKKGDWVEFVHEDQVLRNLAEPLLQVKDIDLQTMEVTLVTRKELPSSPQSARRPILRRWDQSESKNSEMNPEGDITIKEEEWIDIEDGIQILFKEPIQSTEKLHYRTGDYWLIPARVATKDIEWPNAPEGIPPHGVEHHYAPLAILHLEYDNKIEVVECENIKNLPFKFKIT